MNVENRSLTTAYRVAMVLLLAAGAGVGCNAKPVKEGQKQVIGDDSFKSRIQIIGDDEIDRRGLDLAGDPATYVNRLSRPTTPQQLLEAINNPANKQLQDLISRWGIHPATLNVADIKQTEYGKLRNVAIGLGMSPQEAQARFGDQILMTYRNGEDIGFYSAQMYDDLATVTSLRAQGNRRAAWKGDNWWTLVETKSIVSSKLFAVRPAMNLELVALSPLCLNPPQPPVEATPTPTQTATIPATPTPINTPVPGETPGPTEVPTGTPAPTESSVPSATSTVPPGTETAFPPQRPTSVATSTPGNEVPATSTPFSTVTPPGTETPLPGSSPTPHRPTSTPPGTETAFPPQRPTSVATSLPSTQVPPTSISAATVTPFPDETVISGSSPTPSTGGGTSPTPFRP